jgi:hypothetical protein
MVEDICDRLVRFNQHKECVSTDLEVEAAAEIARLREENARLAALSAKASLESSQLRKALKPFARAAEYCEGLGDLDHKSVLVENFRAAAAAIREGGNDEN